MKPLSPKCKPNTCPHKKCECGHCSRYHVFEKGECGKIFPNLHTCTCKQMSKTPTHSINADGYCNLGCC